MTYSSKELSVSSLNIYDENPRFEKVTNQRESITLMIEDQGNKLINLAKDILENGLHPGDPLYVCRNEFSPRKFDVLEGNRRITVLKLLENPNLIPEKKKSILNAFRKLNKVFLENPIDRVNCIVFDKPENADHWIEIKHTGQNNGIGTVTWDTQQKDRFDERVKGKSSFAIQLLDFINSSEFVKDEIKSRLPEVKSSSLQRLASDPDWREVIGIDHKDGALVTKLHPKEIVKPLIKTIKDLLDPDFTVKDIYYKGDRANYIETYTKNDLPDRSKRLAGNWALNSADPPKANSSSGKPKPKTPRDSKPKVRKSIIPKSTVISIGQPRIAKIYRELKDLNLDYTENAAAVLFRVFIELSLDSYLDKNPVGKLDQNSKLKNKLSGVGKDLENKKIMTKHELKAVYTSSSMNDNIMSIDTFNAYVHNKLFQPDQKSLKKTWDNLEHFFVKIWELI